MTDKTTKSVENAQTTVKRNRRGVSNQTRAVSQLKFHEKDAAPNSLFVGHLQEVKVETSVNADASTFTGITVSRLTFHFTSNHPNPNEQRHVYQTLFPVESNVETMMGGTKEWRVNNVLQWIKMMLDTFYLKGRELTVEEEEALTLPFDDSDDEGNYVAVEPEVVANGYATVFENAAAMLNGSWNLKDGEVAKPCYKTADGKHITLWMKLLRHKKVRNEWKNVAPNGELAFDGMIGQGVIEIMKGNNPPSVLRVDLSKESITPKETKKAPSIGVPGVPSMGANFAGGGVMVGGSEDMSTGNTDAYMAAQADGMPF